MLYSMCCIICCKRELVIGDHTNAAVEPLSGNVILLLLGDSIYGIVILLTLRAVNNGVPRVGQRLGSKTSLVMIPNLYNNKTRYDVG